MVGENFFMGDAASQPPWDLAFGGGFRMEGKKKNTGSDQKHIGGFTFDKFESAAPNISVEGTRNKSRPIPIPSPKIIGWMMS